MSPSPHNWLLHHLIESAASRTPHAAALTYGQQTLDYETLSEAVTRLGCALTALGLQRGERVGIYLDKRVEAVVTSFGCSQAGGVFVPINPLLKPDQVTYILRDCNVRILLTSPERHALLAPFLQTCPDLRHLILTGYSTTPSLNLPCHLWQDLPKSPASGMTPTSIDMAAILYTSGSTGSPKGVVLSHRNLLAGAASVADYLGNNPEDSILAALPLSFDAGFSQLTTAFHASARVVLLNYLMPRDLVRTLERERITGLTGVPTLWMQLATQTIPAGITEHLRYIANTGGHMPKSTLQRLMQALPKTRPYLMYGLTEAFRATFLPPEEVNRHPDSIGRAIPDNEVWVLREDGSECANGEPGELVQRGPLVAMGYWNAPEKTAEHFRPLPANLRPHGLCLPEVAVYSGDSVYRDAEGLLYFVGRRDEMIKTSGYRVSPTEVEEVAHSSGLVSECVAFGVPHPALGAAIILVAVSATCDPIASQELMAFLKKNSPAYQVPAQILFQDQALPRNANGKLDRKMLAVRYAGLFTTADQGNQA